MKKRQTPKERLIARLKAEGIIPADHEIVIDVPRYSANRREMQWLPRTVILHRRRGCRFYDEIHSGLQTVTELSRARRLELHGVGTQEVPELVGANSLTAEEVWALSETEG